MSTQTFTIPGRLPGMNEIIAANRTNQYVGAKLKKECDERVGWCAKRDGMKPMRGLVLVRIQWIEKNRLRDPDNIVVGRKFILDALQTIGVLEGDGHAHIAGFVDHFGFSKDDPRVVVTLEEVQVV